MVDVQQSFNPPSHLIDGIKNIVPSYYSVSTVERHNESITPFENQLGWKPGPHDSPMIQTDKTFVKYGYMPPYGLIDHLKSEGFHRIYVCGIQADTCCLCAGFMLFDAGLRPTLLKWLTVGSSLDRSAELGSKLWRHHFGQNTVLNTPQEMSNTRK